MPAAVRLEVAGSLRADPGYVAAAAGRDRLAATCATHITWHGQLDQTQLDALRARCHLFVMPSDREAYPLAALEALGAGLPVLLTDAGGTAELLGSSGAGALLPPDAPTAWVHLIAALAHDRARLVTLARAAAGPPPGPGHLGPDRGSGGAVSGHVDRGHRPGGAGVTGSSQQKHAPWGTLSSIQMRPP